MERSPAPEPLPVLLSKVEALEYAARFLEENAWGVEFAAKILSTFRARPPSEPLAADLQAHLDRWRVGIVDAELQVGAMKAAARSIRDLALEERLVAARTARLDGVKA